MNWEDAQNFGRYQYNAPENRMVDTLGRSSAPEWKTWKFFFWACGGILAEIVLPLLVVGLFLWALFS